jgi:hypothetical protein
MKKRHFVPDPVSSLEDRALLSGFTFPTSWDGNNTLGFRGALVLTSRTYADVQSRIDDLLQTFTRNAIQFYHEQGGFTDAFDARIGVGTYGTGGTDWAYGKGTALARLDSLIASLELKLPYGGGQGTDNPTGGAGLSDRTALTTTNPASSTDAVGSLSVAQLVEQAITDAADAKDLQTNLENVRVQVVAIHGGSTSGTGSGTGSTADSSSENSSDSGNGSDASAADAPFGILPAYIAAFGPSGSKDFGLKNT